MPIRPVPGTSGVIFDNDVRPLMKQFNLTEEHIKLLRGMKVRWNAGGEFGAPGVSPMRPFGNSGHRWIMLDMGKILGVEPDTVNEHGQPWFSAETVDRFTSLFAECEVALQIVLRVGAFEPGLYVARQYFTDWKKADNPYYFNDVDEN